MKNGDIGLLKYYFSAAGQRNQKETQNWLQKVSECLQSAGAGNIDINEKKDGLFFQIGTGRSSGKKNMIQYKLKIIPGGNQIVLEQVSLWEGEAGARKLMCWYAAKRNEKLANGIQYLMNPVHLNGKVRLRDGWETELVHRISDMNRVFINDREIFEALNQGNVPGCIKDQVHQEYQEYEREIEYGVNI